MMQPPVSLEVLQYLLHYLLQWPHRTHRSVLFLRPSPILPSLLFLAVLLREAVKAITVNLQQPLIRTLMITPMDSREVTVTDFSLPVLQHHRQQME